MVPWAHLTTITTGMLIESSVFFPELVVVTNIWMADRTMIELCLYQQLLRWLMLQGGLCYVLYPAYENNQTTV